MGLRKDITGKKFSGAESRGIDFNLSKEDFKILTKMNCFYCGIEPKQVCNNPKHNGSYIYNGIDRIDSQLGYCLENCVPCCKACNIAKSSMTIIEFYEWVNRVYNFIHHTDVSFQI